MATTTSPIGRSTPRVDGPLLPPASGAVWVGGTSERVVRSAAHTADAVAESGVVVDVNAAGLRKPIGEVYPSRQLLEMLHRRGVPIILSSDAHAPQHVAAGRPVSHAS